MLRRETRESGPNAARARKVKELEADEIRLSGLVEQVSGDLKSAYVSLRNAEREENDEADLSRIRRAVEVETRAAQVEAARLEALEAVKPRLLAKVEIEVEQRAARIGAKNALRSMAIRHGVIPEGALPSNEETVKLERFLSALELPRELLSPVVRPVLPVLAWPVLPVQWEE